MSIIERATSSVALIHHDRQGQRARYLRGDVIRRLSWNGKKYHPLPWAMLKYDAQKSGYVVNLDKKQLEGAPNYDRDSEFKWTPDYGRKVDSYYNAPSYWN